ncbi:MAG: hypothetical protein HUJ26_07280 [Planctomycetaceae bacterium]|nr:hypothetical protein [Planctomycetaceae bacterium]
MALSAQEAELSEAKWIATQQARLRDEFEKTDSNGNGSITEAEYQKRNAGLKVLKRDFRLFDFNGDQSLSEGEFACTPGVIHRSLRGPVPDPMEGLRLAAVDALEDSFEQWQENPALEIDSAQFLSNFLKSVSPNGRYTLTTQQIRMADRNGNGRINRDEAVQYLESQLGLRDLSSRLMLREPSGRVLLYHRFISHDANQDRRVSKKEFLDKMKRKDAAEIFQQGDIDGDGFMTIEETAHPRWIGYMDPIMEFRRMDSDFDGLVSLEELKRETPKYRQSLIPQTLPPFDADGDGKLSLSEYRLSLMANPICPWGALRRDANRDQQITFDEFTYGDKYHCHLIWLFYFSHFDTNDDNALTFDEFQFKKIPPLSFHRLSLETGELELFFENETIPHIGSPAVSPDGASILFDGYGSQGIRDSHIYRMTSDGKNVQKLVTGLMPTWSPGGKQFACSRYEDGSTVWLMNIDGTPEKKISEGWGAQWSPDGKYISFVFGREIRFYNVETGLLRFLLQSDTHDYRYFFWNMAWSPDSSRIAIKCYKQNSNEVDIISFNTKLGEDIDLRVHLTTEKNPEADLAWFPQGKHLLITMRDPERQRNLPYKLSIAEGSEPQLLEEIDDDVNYNGATVAPNGKYALFPTRRQP